MLRRLRRARLALAAAAIASLGACSGLIDTPSGAGPCAECGPETPDDTRDGPGPGGGDDGGNTDRPPGVGDPSTPNGVGWTTRFAKLSNRQWENTVTDLFYLSEPTGLSAEFTQERLDAAYETLAAAELTVGGDAWSRYQTAAERIAERVTSDGETLAKLLPADAPSEGSARAESFISAFGRRAYRRPLTDVEKAAFFALFEKGPALVGGDAFAAGARLVIEAMLQSPHFLYRVEQSSVAADADDRKAWLSGYELAARLSYALWNTMPSDALLDAADAGELDTAEGVATWARTLLDDARARDVLLSFHEQTFHVAAYGTQDKDPSLGFDAEALAPVLKEEARKFFEHVVVESEGGIAQLLTEPVAYVNETTAPLYGLSGVSGDALVKRDLDGNERAGLLTQLGFLTKNATRSTSDPVHRGLVVLRQVLCDEPDPPPMMFDLPKPEPGLSTREVYEKATACGVGCHDTLINPPGFAFEVFDAIGRVRSEDAGKPVDATGTLTLRQGYTSSEKRENETTTISFDGAVDLLTQLAEQPRVHECYARNWMSYAMGREIDPVERGAWELLRDGSMQEGAARELIVALVQLDTFRARVSE